MANLDLLVIQSERKKRRPSQDVDLDVNSIIVGGLGITEVGGNLDFGGVKLTNAADPTDAQDVATKAYVDLVGGGGSSLTAGDGIDITSDVISVVPADDSIVVDSSGVSVNYARSLTNEQGSTISATQVVYGSSFGAVSLVSGASSIGPGSVFGVVKDASIADTATGDVYIKPGAIIPGYSSLTIGEPIYVHQSTPGAIIQSTAGFNAGDHLVQIGTALTATSVLFDPLYILQF